ncbi:O-antigen ligase family protein [Actinoplanes derwentensis]|uniref:O-antigen ligase n=1 Tax=Actinoplanes derwentensis TaxID=113562 RepID=A0A1H2BC16_9ACTN|nr:O-antigen ligase family protein [Actinoplanes derwentensis]GID88619.1 O-antigen polymerase [Actinoplanes derwentensis]SDT55694.1 O-antigen ligase [Actinoplanes derwentensis]
MTVHPVDLEPSLIGPGTYTSRRLQVRLDTATVIALLVLLLYCLPAALIVPGLTFAGRPALVLAMGLFAWWLIARLSPTLFLMGPQPLRWTMLFYLVSTLLSYTAGMLRGLPTLEANRQNFTLLVTFQFIGLVLMAADGVANWERLRKILRVFLWAAAFMAVIGLIQSLFEYDIAQNLIVPGLEIKAEMADFQKRGDEGLFRVAGTAIHYIEFSTVLAMAVPFGLHFAMYSPTRRSRRFYAALTGVIAVAVPIAISRTGILALVAAVGVMFFAWSWRTRYNMLFVGMAALVAMAVVRPGVLGTLKSMFLSADEDPSITGRTEDYEMVSYWFSQRPWLGRGPGTLIPDLYIMLDNQWLMTLVTYGIVGLVALAALHITCIAQAGVALRRSTTAEDKHLCAALISSQVVAILVGATFDSFSFTTFAFTLALMSGLSGAVWRFTHPARVVRTSHVKRLFE